MSRLMRSLQPTSLISIPLCLTISLLSHLAQAQTLPDFTSGLFYPRSSEQFFLDGVEQFETEVNCLTDTDQCGLTRENLLTHYEEIRSPWSELLPQEQWLQDRWLQEHCLDGQCLDK